MDLRSFDLRRLRAKAGRLLVLAALAAPVARADTRLGLGADYAFDQRGIFSLNLAADAPVSRRLSLTGRVGGLVTSSPSTAGLPLDVGVRFHSRGVYVEALFGPWIFFTGEAVRGHAGFGIGLESRRAFLGIEGGALGFSGGTALLGTRLGLRL